MREEIDFRIPEKNAQGRLPDDVGERLGDSLRRVRVRTGDALLEQLRQLDREFRARGEVFFTGWNVQRRYSRRELEEAELLHAWPNTTFEPAGEECGTSYDEASACGHVIAPESEVEVSGRRILTPATTCGAGARQMTTLRLDARRVPRSVDFARTIAGEIVVSARVREVFLDNRLAGAEFESVRESNAGGMASSEYYQLKIVSPPVELHAATRSGGNLFDESGYGRCPRGHVVGLNLLSEVYVQRRSLVVADTMVTKQLVGVRRGLLRPQPILLLSPKAYRAIEHAHLKGLAIEVAHVS